MEANFRQYRKLFFLQALMVFLIHGAKLNSDIIGIDTEDLIHLQGGFYGGWLNSGRQGLVLLKYLLGNGEFNPYFSAGMTLLLFAAAAGAFCLLWDSALGKTGDGSVCRVSWAAAGLLWISHPVWAEQFYFSLQSMEIALGMLFTAAALYLTGRFARKPGPGAFLGSLFLLLLTFSSYQAFVAFFIFGTVTILFLEALQSARGQQEQVGAKALLGKIVPYFAVFMAAFVLNMVITRLFFSHSDYLQNQIFWGSSSVKECLQRIISHIIKVFSGYQSAFYSAGFGALALLVLALLLVFLKKNCQGRRALAGVIVFYYLALLCTPFLMTIVLGGIPTVRSQLVLPAAAGFLGYCLVFLMRELKGQGKRNFWEKALLCCGLALCLVCGLEQAKVTAGLYYTDRCRYEQDKALGYALLERIEQVNFRQESLPVVIVGHRDFSPNNACVQGEVIGQSFFAYDLDVEPVSYWSTRRMVGFLHTLGADLYQPPREWLDGALEYSTYMPEWPSEGSVQIKDGMLIIKLSHYE